MKFAASFLAFFAVLIIVPDFRFRRSARVALPVPSAISTNIGDPCRHDYWADESNNIKVGGGQGPCPLKLKHFLSFLMSDEQFQDFHPSQCVI